MQLLCCPFKCMVKMCRCCCKELPESCHACADEKNPQDRKIIMMYEERLRRLEARAPDQKVVPTNSGMQMEQKPASRGMQQMQQSSPTRVMQKMQTRSGRNLSEANEANKGLTAGDYLCNACGLQQAASYYDKILAKLLGRDAENNPTTVYFNVPGLQVEQPDFIKMKPHVPFSLAGVLTKKREGAYMFTIPKCLRRQLRTCQRFGIVQCEKLQQPFELNGDYFAAVMPGHVAMYFISVEPNYTCINPRSCQ